MSVRANEEKSDERFSVHRHVAGPLRATRENGARLRAQRGRAGGGSTRRRALVPVRGGLGHGRHGSVRVAVPRRVRRHGWRLLRAVPCARGTGEGGSERGDHAGGGCVAGGDAGLSLRKRGAEATVAAAVDQRPRACGVRFDRSRVAAPMRARRRPPPGSTTGTG